MNRTLTNQLELKVVENLLKAQVWATTGKLTNRKAFVLGMALAAFGESGGFAQTANTAIDGPFKAISEAICKVGTYLRGPIGIALVLVMIIIAGVGLATGGKNSTGTLISALIGAAIILGARALASIVATSSADLKDGCSDIK
jgi:type IV secretory pathway VirB2 component (pilin)